MEHLGDVELMALVRAGDFRAFDEVHRRHYGAVRRFLYSLTFDEQAAEDCAQDVFVGLFERRATYEPTALLRTFLYRIARNRFLNWRRARLRRRDLSLDEAGPTGAPRFANLRCSARNEPEVHLIEAYRTWRIRGAIRALPPRLRLVFVLARLEGLRYQDIAEVLGIAEGTVKSRMFEAVRRLQETLREDIP